jgi:hypothetical protein
MAPSKKTQAIAALNRAIIQLPEFKALEKLLGHNEAIAAVTVFEQEVHVKPTPNVRYNGLTSDPKKNEKRPYILECCGGEYFTSTKTVPEIAQEIQEAVSKAAKGKDKLGTTFNISQYLSDKLGWDKTDEVYPHMYQQAVGKFEVVGI